MAASFYSDPNWYQQNDPNLASKAAAVGMQPSDYANYLASNPPSYVNNSQGGQYGMSSGSSLQQNPQMTQTLNTLGVMQKYGLGGSGQQGPPTSQAGQVSNDPMNAAVNLGAAALGMPAVYNPFPMAPAAGAKGGVATIGSPTNSGTTPTAPTGPWTNTPGIFKAASMPGQVDTATAQNYFAQQAGNQMGSIKPEEIPGQTAVNYYNAMHPAPPAPGTPTPTTPSNAAAGGAPATPWATAPAAPGIDTSTHTSALANAGMAMYAHYGGDPSTASHADIMNFHNQLLAGIGGAAPGGGPTAGGAATALGTGGPPPAPVKMATGGIVPGDPDDDTDSVPAYLTPGEMVISKPQVKKLSEAQHRALDNPNQPNQPAQSQTTSQNTQTPSSAPPAAPGGGNNSWSQIIQQAQQARANNMSGLGSGAYSGGGGTTVGDVAGGAAIPNAGQTQSLGQAPASGAGASSAISGLASGLSAAAQAYANSIKPWQPQKNAIPAPPASYQQDQQQFGQMTT